MTTKQTIKSLGKFGAVPIALNSIQPTLEAFSKVVDIPIKDLHVLGSTGKQPISGDIDIALDINLYDPIKIHARLSKHHDGQFLRSNMIGSYAFPTADGKLVQIDLMYTHDVHWAEFAYFSAGDASEYKGAVRTLMLMGIAATWEDSRFTNFVYTDSGELRFRAGVTFDLNNGLRSIYQYKKMKDGVVAKTFIKINFNEAVEMFPNEMFKLQEFSCSDPKLVLKTLFGKKVSTSDVETTEQILELIKTIFPPIVQETIFQRTAARAMGIKHKMMVPEEISKFFN